MHAVEGIEGQAHSSLSLSALAVMGGVARVACAARVKNNGARISSLRTHFLR